MAEVGSCGLFTEWVIAKEKRTIRGGFVEGDNRMSGAKRSRDHASNDDSKRRTAFREEALPHLGSLYRAAVQLTRDPTLAEDLVQDAYREAWSSFDRYRLGTNCKGWLFRILFRVRSRHLRSVAKSLEVPLEDAPIRCLEAAHFEAEVEARLMLRVLKSLPEQYRLVLVLADLEELSYKEIASAIRAPIGTVMSRLNRARRLLRKQLVGSTAWAGES